MSSSIETRELDAVMGERANDPRLKPLFPDPQAEAQAWYRKNGIVPLNHLVVVSEEFVKSYPDLVHEFFRMLKLSKQAATPAAGNPDFTPLGLENMRQPLARIIEYAHQQALIPRRFSVDELFDDTTRGLN
jgi:4,5-dihydroxyphthalate decarboxylase